MNTVSSQLPERERPWQVPGPSRWRVSDLVLDTRRQRVWRDSHEIPLPKLTYDLLVALVRCHPTVISDGELMALVWPGLVVSQETISQRVKLLREALGDDSRNPRYVARLRSRGYYLVGTVESLPDVEEAPPLMEALRPDALMTAAEELALLEPEWCPGPCDRPEWAVTQVIPLDTLSGIFPNLAATARPAAEAADSNVEESSRVAKSSRLEESSQ